MICLSLILQIKIFEALKPNQPPRFPVFYKYEDNFERNRLFIFFNECLITTIIQFLLFYAFLVFHTNSNCCLFFLSDSKSLQSPINFLSILAKVNSAVVRKVLIKPVISNSLRHFRIPLGTNYNWNHPPLHVSQLFRLIGKIHKFFCHFNFLYFHSRVLPASFLHLFII